MGSARSGSRAWTADELAVLRAEAARPLALSRLQQARRIGQLLGRSQWSVWSKMEVEGITTLWRHECDLPD